MVYNAESPQETTHGQSNNILSDYTTAVDVSKLLLDSTAEHNMFCREPIIADGKIHRFANHGKGNKNGWYIVLGNCIIFGDWQYDIRVQFYVGGYKKLSFHDRIMLDRKIRIAKKHAEQERLQAQEKAAYHASIIMETGTTTGNSPYLARKRVDAFGLAFHSDYIAIPLHDIDGTLWSVQKIYADGTKRFLTDGKKQGCFHIIGDTEILQHVYVCEGYATAASVYMASNTPTILCFDTGNLEPVIRAFKQHFRKLDITIAADNDAYGARNIGKEKAEDAARKYGCKVVLPVFNTTEGKPTDFNDLHVMEGLDYVRKSL